MLMSNLGAGVQACYRGPRLYDTQSTRQMVRQTVAWFKQYRDILESDIIHGASRRANGRDIDWFFHANPRLDHKGMLLVYNPLRHDVTRTIDLDLYYTGLPALGLLRSCLSDPPGSEGSEASGCTRQETNQDQAAYVATDQPVEIPHAPGDVAGSGGRCGKGQS